MAFEIERKFLVRNDNYRAGAKKNLILQGFLNNDLSRMVRVRITNERGFITVKGPARGSVRREFEYPIPLHEAEIMIRELCLQPPLEKYRFEVEFNGLVWEIDEFMGENSGLVIAEVELPDKDHALTLPEWAGPEVTGDSKYYNASLVSNPYRQWDKMDQHTRHGAKT